MLVKLFHYLKQFFVTPKKMSEEGTETPKPPPNPWPYSGSEPTPAILMALLEGTVIEGDHVFYYSKLKEKTGLRIDGTYSNAMIISYWISGKENPNGLPIVPNCGDQKCIKLDHLRVNAPKPKKATPAPKKQEKKQTTPTKKAPVANKYHVPEKPPESDRTKCQTAKIYFPSGSKARRAQQYYNFWNKRNRVKKKSYVYDCHLCDGWHLTSSNPEKRKFKAPGSW